MSGPKAGSSEALQERERKIFEEYSIPKAIAAMVLPTIMSQIIFVVYNLADTWFVGRVNDPHLIAAISLCLPVYQIMTALANLFGIGGAAVIARALGTKDHGKARQAFALSVYSALIAACVYAVTIAIVQRPLLLMIGGVPENIDHAVTYATYVIVIGALPSILSTCFSHLIRAGGFSAQASFGLILGAISNVLLDPLFMFVLFPPGNELAGAAVATVLSNVISLIYFSVYIFKMRRTGLYTFQLSAVRNGGDTWKTIASNGLPSFAIVAFAMLSHCFLNSMLSELGSEAIAGVGLVRKIDQFAFAVNQGITQGMLPLAAYNYSNRNYKRMWAVVGFAAVCTEVVSISSMTISQIFSEELVMLFIQDPLTVALGAQFLKVLCLALPIYSVTFIVIAVLQAVGKVVQPFLLSVMRKVPMDVFIMLLIRHLYGVEYITWANPASEAIAMVAALIMIFRLRKKLSPVSMG